MHTCLFLQGGSSFFGPNTGSTFYQAKRQRWAPSVSLCIHDLHFFEASLFSIYFQPILDFCITGMNGILKVSVCLCVCAQACAWVGVCMCMCMLLLCVHVFGFLFSSTVSLDGRCCVIMEYRHGWKQQENKV